MTSDHERLQLVAYVAWRVVLFGSLALALVLAVRAGSARMSATSVSDSFSGASFEESPTSEAGNQFRMNNQLMELAMESSQAGGESPMGGLALSQEIGGEDRRFRLTPLGGASVPSVSAESGDAPGFDIVGVPRVPGMQRWMSFEDPTSQYQSVFYGRSSASPLETLKWYEQALLGLEWTIVRRNLESEEEPYLFASRANQLVMIRTSKDCELTCSVVQSTEL